jgi:hypothetical protein
MFDTLQVKFDDILVSFDSNSPSTRVLIEDSLNLLSQQVEEGNVRLFHCVLTSPLASSLNRWMELLWAHCCYLSLPTSLW